MGIIAILISVSISIALIFLGVFLWSLKSGQFDDTTTPAMRMIFDEFKSPKEPAKTVSPSSPGSADKNQPEA